MTDAPAGSTTLDILKDAFLRNAVRTDDRAFDLRETVLASEANPAAEAGACMTNKTEPAESRA
ncbi:hypothetical protein [Methylopila sp. M107]|uniref:hypothetical protein n=1 Tax=Methylopila sp. M107 TaxID=1101190 RepID=UPI0003A75EBA|nr:hypothetical protein [Methylopila sp. M107]